MSSHQLTERIGGLRAAGTGSAVIILRKGDVSVQMSGGFGPHRNKRKMEAILLRNQKHKRWEKRDGKRVLKHLSPIQFYVSESLDFESKYVVTELRTGAWIAKGEARREAVANARNRLFGRTLKNIQEAIDRTFEKIERGEA